MSMFTFDEPSNSWKISVGRVCLEYILEAALRADGHKWPIAEAHARVDDFYDDQIVDELSVRGYMFTSKQGVWGWYYFPPLKPKTFSVFTWLDEAEPPDRD